MLFNDQLDYQLQHKCILVTFGNFMLLWINSSSSFQTGSLAAMFFSWPALYSLRLSNGLQLMLLFVKIKYLLPESSGWFQAFSFLCTFVPGSEKSTEKTLAFVELSFRVTFAPVELSFLGSERSKNFRSYETVLSWERIFHELSLQMS